MKTSKEEVTTDSISDEDSREVEVSTKKRRGAFDNNRGYNKGYNYRINFYLNNYT